MMTCRSLLALWFAWAALLAPGTASAAETKATPLGREVKNFTLQDFRGKPHALSDYRDSKVVVLAFLGTECPLAKLYAARLSRLAEEYEKSGVTVLGINANCQDSITEIAAFARIHRIDFPLLKDVGNRLADQLGAVRTPEVFVLDEERAVRYWGRIDDQYGIGYVKEAPQRRDLAEALDDVLAGKKVRVPVTEVAGCHIGRVPEADAASEVTYGNQISRILQKHCVECHREGEIAPFALTEYDEVAGWARMIKEVVQQQRMPPWHASPEHGSFANDRRMSDSEKELIDRWVRAGAPRGELSRLPKPREYVSGWQLPQEPDVVLTMRDEPFEVAAEGVIRYQYFSVDPGFEEDKWVRMAEVRPGNRAVVHHILVFARPKLRTAVRNRGAGGGGFLAAYVPGLRAEPFPEGMARLVPAGSKLVFQVHYTPIGSVQQDRSMIGLVLAEPDEVTHVVKTGRAAHRGLEIPPGAENHRVEAQTAAPSGTASLLAMMPHMHLRGKSFRYDAVLPGGRRKTLLDVPNYDFNWQTSYRLADPKQLPPGTRIQCTAHYDNSEANLANPDPTATVRWGDQTWNEMMIGYFEYAVPIKPASTEAGRSQPASRAEQVMARFDKNEDGRVTRDELPLRLLPIHRRLDADGDGGVTPMELNESGRSATR